MEGTRKLSDNQQQFIAALLIEPTIAQAAVRAGIDVATAVQWLRQPDVQVEYRLAQRERGASAVEGFQQVVTDALAVLQRHLAPNVPPELQVRAAMSVLELARQIDPYGIREYVEFFAQAPQLEAMYRATVQTSGDERRSGFQAQADIEPERVISPDFNALKPGQLKKIAVEVQALDDQWVSQGMLLDMLKNGWSLAGSQNEGEAANHFRAERAKAVLREYRRALINAEQLIINRAYFYNNRVLVADSTSLHPEQRANREAFRQFLTAGDIVPRLYDESHPATKPSFQVYEEGWNAWQTLCQEVHMHCLRLSWDDDENEDLIEKHFTRPFHNFAHHAWTGNMEQYLLALGQKFSQAAPFQQRLLEMSQACLEISEGNIRASKKGKERLVTRSKLYERFVCKKDTKVSDGVYDVQKAFSGEIKQLLDLAYNSYPPDALGIYTLTPADSLPRSALQDFDLEEVLKQPEVIGADQLLQIIKGLAFKLVQQGLDLPAMDWLTLTQVQQIRKTKEWYEYIQSLEQLLNHPFDFANPEGGARRVYQSYIALAQRMRAIVADHFRERLQPWAPGAELSINAGAAALIARLTPDGVLYKVVGDMLQPVVPVVVHYGVRGLSQVGAPFLAQADFAMRSMILKRRMKQAREQWEALVRKVGELPGWRQWEGDAQPVQATLGSSKA